jgi:hypothetical protein
MLTDRPRKYAWASSCVPQLPHRREHNSLIIWVGLMVPGNSVGSTSILEKVSSAIVFCWFLIMARQWALTSRASLYTRKMNIFSFLLFFSETSMNLLSILYWCDFFLQTVQFDGEWSYGSSEEDEGEDLAILMMIFSEKNLMMIELGQNKWPKYECSRVNPEVIRRRRQEGHQRLCSTILKCRVHHRCI